MLKPLTIAGRTFPAPIIQGGMGIGIAMSRLAAAVSAEGGLGIVSCAAMDVLLEKEQGRSLSRREAVTIEVRKVKDQGLPVGVNLLRLEKVFYAEELFGALDAGADYVFSGGGLPLDLPVLVKEHGTPFDQVGLIPIVSSARALQVIQKRWARAGTKPAAVVLEGPLAGGHLGFRSQEEADAPENQLTSLLSEVLEVAEEIGDCPVIVAGGIYSHEDIVAMQALGAAGVQMGTRFLATEEACATDEFKKAVVDATEQNILLAVPPETPGSPCQLPFRVLTNSAMMAEKLSPEGRAKRPHCTRTFLFDSKGCPALREPENYFCICNGLLDATQMEVTQPQPLPLYTVGTVAAKIQKIVPVSELMAELQGDAVILELNNTNAKGFLQRVA